MGQPLIKVHRKAKKIAERITEILGEPFLKSVCISGVTPAS